MSERGWQRLYELVDAWRGQGERYASANCCCCCEARSDIYRECANQLEALLAEMRSGLSADA